MRRVFLKEQVKFIGYNKLATHWSEISLSGNIDVVSKEKAFGVAVAYRLLLKHTIQRILTSKQVDIKETDYPFVSNLSISDGLDGSVCHRIYQQEKPLSTDQPTLHFICIQSSLDYH